ncbi:hypothetical protein [Jannaschia formosa]|uniref:hypothetical protein n=1 Tax=Jannaschia formosa TaxID=2259592 RepID=UPI001075387E|nr:hypothetical protein [Jannaschia formosa]TFL16831.1 hypothetical protein DR046_17640 [Jannaschia formosa]
MWALLGPAADAAGPLPEGGLSEPADAHRTAFRPMTEALGPGMRPLLAVAAESGGALAETCVALDAALREGALDLEDGPVEAGRDSRFVYPVV